MRFKTSDRDAIIVIMLVAVVVILIFPLLGDKTEGTSQRFVEKRWQKKERGGSQQESQHKYYAQPERTVKETFPFDPNTADSTTLLRLGLRPWQVRNIYKYRAKGGRYRQKEDFARLYGLTLEDYRRLEPYIRIKPEVMAADVIKPKVMAADVIKPKGSSDVPRPSAKMRHDDAPVDINTADTTALKRIPGIGSYFARRIVELRQRRQAFVSTEELLSIRNFPETALTYMTASQHFAKIHVNSATLQQLRSHPLINYTQATEILKYRRTNGRINSEKDISFLPSFTKEQLQRLTPFLIYD